MKETTSKFLAILCILFIFGCSKFEDDVSKNITNDQSQPSHGALFLTEEEYAKLPTADFNLLQRNSRVKERNILRSSTSSSSASTTDGVVLMAPQSGNQGAEGSCVAWAVGYSAMGILSLPKYNYNFSAYRSPEYVYNQIKVGDCNSGAYISSGLNLIKNQGVCSWQLMPYTDAGCSIQPNQAQIADAANNKATNFATISRNNVTQLKNAVALGWPVVVGFDVTNSFMSMWNNGGIWTTNSGPSQGGHAACIVGYDDTRRMFKVQNQWGDWGGDGEGFFWVSYTLVSSGCFREAFVVYTTSSSEPLSVVGPKQLCTNATYSVDNLPPGSTVSWSAAPAGVVTLSPNNNTVTVTKAGGGIFSLKAIVSNAGGEAIIDRTALKAGAIPPTISGGSAVYAPNSSYNFSSEGTDWKVIGGTIIGGQGTNTIVVITASFGTLRVSARDTNCGGSSYSMVAGRIDSDRPPF